MKEKSCGGVLFTRSAEGLRYVLVRSLAGHYGFPKGHMEPGETEEETALREIREEVGVRARLLAGFRKENCYRLPCGERLKQVICFLAEYEPQPLRHMESEILEARSVTFNEGQALLEHESDRRILQQADDFLKREKQPYYKAYDERYKTAHGLGIHWFSKEATAAVERTIGRFGITREHAILEMGCGEGRDAAALLRAGYQVTAVDVSPQAVHYCRERWSEHRDNFHVLDITCESMDRAFDFIYAVAVLHMLIDDRDRRAFYDFIRNHLNPEGIALVCVMGDGKTERCSDAATAFELQPRKAGGQTLWVAGTSCRMVSRPDFIREITQSGLRVLEQGFTEKTPDYGSMMYAVIKKE